MDNTQRVVYVAANSFQAHLMRNLLAEQGIKAFVTNAYLNGQHFEPLELLVALAGGTGFHPNLPRVVVHRDDEDRARRLVLAAEDSLSDAEAADELEDHDELEPRADAVAAERPDWPTCPDCHRRQPATCPACKTSGVAFPRPFMPEASPAGAAADRPLPLLCTTCDETFEPVYPAECAWCGHPIADGTPADSTDLHAGPDAANHPLRALVVIVGILVVVGGILLGFANLLQTGQ